MLWLLLFCFSLSAEKMAGSGAEVSSGAPSSWRPFSLPVISVTRKDQTGSKGPFGEGTCELRPGRFGDLQMTVRDGKKSRYEYIVDMNPPNEVLSGRCLPEIVRDGEMTKQVISCQKSGSQMKVKIISSTKDASPLIKEATWKFTWDRNGVSQVEYFHTQQSGRITDNFQCGEAPTS